MSKFILSRKHPLILAFLFVFLLQQSAWCIEIKSYPIGMPRNCLQKGFSYYLPRTRLKLSYTVELFKITVGAAESYRSWIIQDSILLEADKVSDHRVGFFVPTARLKSLMVETKLANFNFEDNGTLSSATLSTIDRTPDVITDVVQTAENVAKTIAIIMAMTGDKTSDRYKNQGAASAIKYVDTWNIVQYVDPEEIGLTYSPRPCARLETMIKDTIARENGDPQSLRMERLLMKTNKLSKVDWFKQSVDKGKAIKGIVVRTPCPTVYEFAARFDDDPADVFTQLDSRKVSVYQNGFVSHIPVHWSLFTDRYQKLSMSASEGFKYELKTTSAVERASKVFADIAENLLNITKFMPTVKFDVQQKIAEANKGLVDAEIARKTAEKERDELSKTVVNGPATSSGGRPPGARGAQPGGPAMANGMPGAAVNTPPQNLLLLPESHAWTPVPAPLP